MSKAAFGSSEVASVGGKARAVSMTPEQRRECARKAGNTRLGNEPSKSVELSSMTMAELHMRMASLYKEDERVNRDILGMKDRLVAIANDIKETEQLIKRRTE